MILVEAITHLTEFKKSDSLKYHPDLRDAVQLGIEALKRVKACRPVDLYAPEILLPGETEE